MPEPSRIVVDLDLLERVRDRMALVPDLLIPAEPRHDDGDTDLDAEAPDRELRGRT